MVIQHARLIHACRPVHEKPQRAAAQRTKRGRDDAVSAPLQIRVRQAGRSNAHARSAEYSYCICTITN